MLLGRQRCKQAFYDLERTTGRLEMERILADLFRDAEPEVLAQIVYLTQGSLRPAYKGEGCMSEKAEALAALCARLRSIPHPSGTGPVCGEGNPEATLALVGEAPGEREARLGRPFVGRAGRLLDQVLAEVGHNRGDLWITNVVKFRPTVEVAGRLRNRAPTGAEMRQWLPALQEELQILAPRAILCLGAVAAKVLIDPKFTLSRECGQWRPGPFGSVIAATYHPAYLLRLEGEAYQRALAEFRADLQAALATAAGAAAVPKAFGMNRSEQNPRDAQGVEGREVGR